MFERDRLLKSLSYRVRRLRRRQFRSYCVGAAKTGTKSIASMFGVAYRAQHEPEAQRTIHLVINYLEGEIKESELKTHLIARDRRLRLELESAHPLAYLAGALTVTFPDARFIVTIREPLSWLRSRLNFHHKTPASAGTAWAAYRDYFWEGRHEEFASEEDSLRRYGLYPLNTYLSQYADHYRRVLSEVPEERRMIVRTNEINQKIDAIAKFVGANPIRLNCSHKNSSDNKITPLAEMDETFVKDRIVYHCGELIEQFFTEKLSYYNT